MLVAVDEVTEREVKVVVAKVEVPVIVAWPEMARLPVRMVLPVTPRWPAMVEVAVEEVETKARAVEVAEVERAPVKVIPPLAVRAPVKVEAPATAKVEDKVAAPATVKVDSVVTVDWKVAGDLERKVSLEPPPKAAELPDTLVKEPNWPEKDLAEKEPVAVMELVERWLVVMVLLLMKLVSRDWGLKLVAVKVPDTVRSLLTVRFSWIVADWLTLRV